MKARRFGTALALLSVTVAAAHKDPSSQPFPLRHGMLRGSAETVEGPRPCDWCDLFVDDVGNLVVSLLDVRSSAESTERFAATLVRDTRSALVSHQALHSVVNALELQLATFPGVEVALVVLRMSQRDAKVEVLNAGMPAVANAGPGRLELYPALSSPVGRRVGEVHPYELVPLAWGTTWLSVSDGMVNGSLDPENVTALCARLDLARCGPALAAQTSDELYGSFQVLLSSTRFLRDDATAVVVTADPSARFQSGIDRT